MEILTSWRRRRAERRTKKREKAVSDGIDVQIELERNLNRKYNILLIGSSHPAVYGTTGTAWADMVTFYPPGNNDTEASAIIKRMKCIHYDGYTRDELAHFRLVIWKSLLEKSRNIVQALRTFDLEPTDHTNKVRRPFYTFSVSYRGRLSFEGEVRVHYEPSNGHR